MGLQLSPNCQYFYLFVNFLPGRTKSMGLSEKQPVEWPDFNGLRFALGNAGNVDDMAGYITVVSLPQYSATHFL